MTPMQRIELKLLEALPTLSLRPTLEKAAEVGELLLRAQAELPKGEYCRWLKRVRLSRSSAGEYVSVARYLGTGDVRRGGHQMGFREFINHLRRAKYLERQRDRRERRDALARDRGRLPDQIKLFHADAAKHDWPDGIDLILTDPPWADLESFASLGRIAATKLKPGGLVVTICGTSNLPEVMECLREAGLSYVWMLAFAYSQSSQAKATGSFRGTHRPVLLYSRGKWPGLSGKTMSDFYTVRPETKPHHVWEQPEAFTRYVLESLTEPGHLVCAIWCATRSASRARPACRVTLWRCGLSARKSTGRTTGSPVAAWRSCKNRLLRCSRLRPANGEGGS